MFDDLAPQFERATGHTLAIRYGLVAAQKELINSGYFDLAIVPAPVLDTAIKESRIALDTRIEVARVGLGVAVRVGSVRPQLVSIEAYKRVLLNAKSVSFITFEPAGKAIITGFERLRIAEQMKAKTKSHDSAARVLQTVASGEVELAFGVISNILAFRDVELAGPVPPELQYYIVMTAGIGVKAKQPDAARALVKYLLTPTAAAVMKMKGLEPVTP